MATQETTSSEIVANVDKYVDQKDAKFRFKKDKLGNKRADVELKLPVPSVEGIIKILQDGGKGLELLQDAVYDTVRSVAAGLVAEDPKASQDNFPFDKVTWNAIANMERADRRSVQIPEETWAAFATEYLAIMPALTGKSNTAIETAVQIYLKKMTPVKTNKEALKKLQDQLALYIDNTKNGDEFADILEMLVRRTENYLAADEPQILVENL